jgi:hypothetical protein
MTPEEIEAIRKRAEAATPQNFDSASHVYEGGDVTCPNCDGEGFVTVAKDYLNYDGAALGVQFYGIGDEPGNAEAYYRAVRPEVVLALLSALEAAERRAGEAEARCNSNEIALDRIRARWRADPKMKALDGTRSRIAGMLPNDAVAIAETQERVLFAEAERDTLRARVERLETALREIQKHADKYSSAGALQGPMEYQADPRGRKKAWNTGAYDAAKPIARMTRAALTEKEPSE